MVAEVKAYRDNTGDVHDTKEKAIAAELRNLVESNIDGELSHVTSAYLVKNWERVISILLQMKPEVLPGRPEEG